MDKDLKNKTLGELEQILTNLNQKRYLAQYIFSFIHTRGTTDITQITPLTKIFRAELTGQGYYISALKTFNKLTDPDGTVKYLFELPDNNRIQTVLLFDDKRTTLCVSTQVGCTMGCAFCATAKIPFRRNLDTAEIVDQLYRTEKDNHRVTNVVFMGMGEPMQNYENVLKAVRMLNNPQGKNFSIRHLTISTCGVAPAINKLAREDVRPRLAVSLNAPTDSLRSKLMPINKKYPLAALIKAIKLYQLRTKQRTTFEYVLIKGINDSPELARRLVRLLRDLRCNVNLIEYNPHSGCNFTPSEEEDIKRFAKILKSAGIETSIRLRKGRSIKAACGQLGAE